MKNFTLAVYILLCSLATAQSPGIQSGPMVGYSEMKEVAIWIQTTSAAQVVIAYTPADGEHEFKTEPATTAKGTAFTATLICDSVSEGTQYTYRVFINGNPIELDRALSFETQKLWQWREDPPAFSFAIGSCLYVNEKEVDRPGKPYGSHYEVFKALNDADPNMMLWLGDNTYLREVDWYSRTGILHRYTHSRSLPELQEFLGHVHHYATWDDHDYGPNNADRSFRNKAHTKEAFDLFWANPTSGLNNEGVTTLFQWADMDYFLLDNRWFRNSNRRSDLDSMDRVVFGQEQLEWLFDNLVNSYAPYKFIAMGGQFLNTTDGHENLIHLAPSERQQIIDFIYEHDIEGVIFLTGDRHHSELSVLEEEGEPRIYDVTISPLTAGTAWDKSIEEPNTLRVDDTWVNKHCFGLFEVSGPRKNRDLLLKVIDSEGALLWEYDLSRLE